MASHLAHQSNRVLHTLKFLSLFFCTRKKKSLTAIFLLLAFYALGFAALAWISRGSQSFTARSFNPLTTGGLNQLIHASETGSRISTLNSSGDHVKLLVLVPYTRERGYLEGTLNSIRSNLGEEHKARWLSVKLKALDVRDPDQVQPIFRDPFPRVPGNKLCKGTFSHGTTPNSMIRRQTADFVNMLQHVHCHEYQFVLLWEDDQTMCPGALRFLLKKLEIVLQSHPSFFYIQVGMGGSGLLFNSVYLPQFLEFAKRSIMKRPFDNLVQMFAEEFRYPTFTSEKVFSVHRGSRSSFPNRKHPKPAECFSLMNWKKFHVSGAQKHRCWTRGLEDMLCDPVHYRHTPTVWTGSRKI